MTQSNDYPFLHPTRIDIPVEIRAYLITLLYSTLSCSVDLRSHIKQTMWTIKGADVLQLQALFATMATELEAYADLVAERIAVLGRVARSTARTAATQSTLLEYPSDLIEGSAHVLALAERFASYATALRTSIKHATDVEDVGSAALYTDNHARGREAARALESQPPPLRGTRSPEYRAGRKRARSRFFLIRR